jgi:large subunit ribosomal protein L15
MQVHNLKPKTKSNKAPRVGRGGKRGTYSGKGMKGQKAHAGRKIPAQLKEQILRLPKLRGATNKVKKVDIFEIQLKTLIQKCPDNFKVNLESLRKLKLVPKRVTKFKIIGKVDSINKKLFLKDCKITKLGASLIEKAGGKVEFSK